MSPGQVIGKMRDSGVSRTDRRSLNSADARFDLATTDVVSPQELQDCVTNNCVILGSLRLSSTAYFEKAQRSGNKVATEKASEFEALLGIQANTIHTLYHQSMHLLRQTCAEQPILITGK
jgi:hypothetical protein